MMRDSFDWLGREEVMALVKRFETMIENGSPLFFDVDEFESVIDYYYDMHDIDMSEKAIEEALQVYPSSSSFNIRRARVQANRKNYYEALELLNHMELLEPTNEEIYTTKAEIYSLMNKYELAIKEHKKSLPYSENQEDIYASIAFEYENLNDYPNAIRNLKKALEINPESENLIHEIAFFFEITSREEEAVKFFTEFLDKNPYSKVAWFNLGIFYNTLELYEKAIEAYEFTIAIDESFSSAYFNIANSYSGLNHHKKSIRYYKETFKYEAEEAITHYYIGECHENLDDIEQAIVHFNKALELDEKLAEAWAGIGRVNIKQGSDQSAVKYYERAIELMPLNNDFKYELAVSYLKRSFHDKAELLFNEIVESDVHYIEAWMNYSYSVSLSSSNEKAIEIIEKALDKNKEEASLWYRLAAYLYKSGKVQQSYYYIETALKNDFEKHQELLEFMPELTGESRFIELLGIYKGTE